MSLREIQVLKVLPIHPNIITLHDVIYGIDGQYALVFEYAAEGSLEDYMERVKKSKSLSFAVDNNPVQMNKQLLPEDQIKSIVRDVLNGLNHLHERGYFHRDIKPANLLLSANGDCKVADFTLARFQLGARPDSRPLTVYISTRWYRPPEILLHSPTYGAPVDIYATGCVAAELYTGEPLFPGSTDIDQLDRIFRGIGIPTLATWPDGVKLMEQMQLSCSVGQYNGCLRSDLPVYLAETTMQLMEDLLALDPNKRPSAAQALTHPYFDSRGVHALVTPSEHPPCTSNSRRPIFQSPTSVSTTDHEDSLFSPNADVPDPRCLDLPSPDSVIPSNLADSKKMPVPKVPLRNPYRKRKAA